MVIEKVIKSLVINSLNDAKPMTAKLNDNEV